MHLQKEGTALAKACKERSRERCDSRIFFSSEQVLALSSFLFAPTSTYLKGPTYHQINKDMSHKQLVLRRLQHKAECSAVNY